MKIAFAIESINKQCGKKGAERVLAELANEFSERGHEVIIFCTDINSRDEFMYPILLQVQYCNLSEEHSLIFIDRAKFKFGKIFMCLKWKFFNAIKQLIQNSSQFFGKNSNKPSNTPSDKKNPYRLMQSNLARQLIKQNAPKVLILFNGLNFFLHTLSDFSKERDFPIIYSFHNPVSVYFDSVSSNQYKLAGFNKILELVDTILVLLPEFIDELPNPLQNKALSIPNPIDQVDKHKRANPELNTGLKTILTVGRLVTLKNHTVLLEAFANLFAEHPDWQIKIFGEGELTDQIQKLKLTDKVFLMGVTDAIHEEYQKAHILALPSKFEGFPLVLGEAMAHGLPAVGFNNVSGVNFLIQHEHNGLLADGNDPVDGLTSCLKQLMTNPLLRAELGQNGVESMKLYNQKEIYDLWEKTILETKNNFNKNRI